MSASFSVDTSVIAHAAGRVADSTATISSAAGMLSGVGESCAQTPAAGAADDLANVARSVLHEQVEAMVSLSRALSTAAVSYAIADQTVIKG